jgi:hypothetical protein
MEPAWTFTLIVFILPLAALSFRNPKLSAGDLGFAAYHSVIAAVPLHLLFREMDGAFLLDPFLEGLPLFTGLLTFSLPSLTLLACLAISRASTVRTARRLARRAELAGAGVMALWGAIIVIDYSDHQGHGGEVIFLGFGGLLLSGLLFCLALPTARPFQVEGGEGESL